MEAFCEGGRVSLKRTMGWNRKKHDRMVWGKQTSLRQREKTPKCFFWGGGKMFSLQIDQRGPPYGLEKEPSKPVRRSRVDKVPVSSHTIYIFI